MNNQSDCQNKEDSWGIFRIMAEFVDSLETRSNIGLPKSDARTFA